MPALKVTSTESSDLTVHGYCGRGSALFAFDLPESAKTGLAGFAIERHAPDGTTMFLPNRLNFATKVTAATTPKQRKWTPSNEAPFQKFRWADFPPVVVPGDYEYEVTAMYFDKKGVKTGPKASVKMALQPGAGAHYELGFTRGYLSSQAYAAEFNNAPIRPPKKSIDFDTAPFEKQYAWLGFHARKMVFDFLTECEKDPSITVDFFGYDLDEPDFIRGLQKLGGRLRAYLDNAPLHTAPTAMEIPAHDALVKSAGDANVKQGHFKRFAHCKVLIQKKDGKAVKVLTGSANFSVRGLYVQANSVLVFSDPKTADLYEQAFEQAFTNAAGFAKSKIASQYFDCTGPGLPNFAVALSPHQTAEVSMKRVADAMAGAQSSVMFAVMQLSGSGAVMDTLKTLATKGKVFSYGITQSLAGDLRVFKPGAAKGVLTPFAFLKSKVPPPFQQEFDGGPGQVIHHKFIVVDFNGKSPLVFCGSSNLADGGEVSNGDNLLAISDPAVGAAYGVEAIRLVDHFQFRASMQAATTVTPLMLDSTDKWAAAYYDPSDIHFQERLVFAGTTAPKLARGKAKSASK